jgi:polyphosphate glucokinase
MQRPVTLCLDIGGTHVKALALDITGDAVGEPWREDTPAPAVPTALVALVVQMVAAAPTADRVAIGFPGVVQEGVTETAPNLGEGWHGYALAAELELRTGKPVRIANDADLAGLAVIEGRGVEMVLTLGTGMGAGLYVDGRLVPNLELGHHPFGDGRTYEQRISNAELGRIGEDAWRARVLENVALIQPIFNPRRIYLGGGNARLLRDHELPAGVVRVDNSAGVRGAVRLFAPAFSERPAEDRRPKSED